MHMQSSQHNLTFAALACACVYEIKTNQPKLYFCGHLKGNGATKFWMKCKLKIAQIDSIEFSKHNFHMLISIETRNICE